MKIKESVKILFEPVFQILHDCDRPRLQSRQEDRPVGHVKVEAVSAIPLFSPQSQTGSSFLTVFRIETASVSDVPVLVGLQREVDQIRNMLINFLVRVFGSLSTLNNY
jgi:hypothetical protein